MPDHKPKLERAKTAPELDVPVAIINHRARFRGLVAQVLRQNRQRLDQLLAVGDIEAVAIEVGEHPFVRVEAVAVGEFHAIVNKAKLRAERGRAAHGGIDVQPEIVLAADAGNFAHGVDRVRRRRADGCADEAGNQAGLNVSFDVPCQRFGTHGEVLVHFDVAQVVRTHADNLHRLFDGGVGLGGAIGDQASIAAFAIAGELRRTFACGQQRGERGAGCCVLNHSASTADGKKFFRQAQHGNQPIQHVRFKLGARRTGGPEHALHAQSGGK